MMVVIPSFITASGLWCGLLGLYLMNPVLLAMSLLCDMLDGYLARTLGVVTKWGGELDWHVDVGLAAIALWMVAPYLLPALVVLQATAKVTRKRVSGRTVVFLCLIVGLCVHWF